MLRGTRRAALGLPRQAAPALAGPPDAAGRLQRARRGPLARWPGRWRRAVTAAVGCVARQRCNPVALACQPPGVAQRLAGSGSRSLGRSGTPVSAAASGPVTAALVPRRAGVPPQAAGLPGSMRRVGGGPPTPPRRGALHVRRVALLALQPGRLPLAAGGARFGIVAPRPPRAVAVLALQPGTACAGCARRRRPV